MKALDSRAGCKKKRSRETSRIQSTAHEIFLNFFSSKKADEKTQTQNLELCLANSGFSNCVNQERIKMFILADVTTVSWDRNHANLW